MGFELGKGLAYFVWRKRVCVHLGGEHRLQYSFSSSLLVTDYLTGLIGSPMMCLDFPHSWRGVKANLEWTWWYVTSGSLYRNRCFFFLHIHLLLANDWRAGSAWNNSFWELRVAKQHGRKSCHVEPCAACLYLACQSQPHLVRWLMGPFVVSG